VYAWIWRRLPFGVPGKIGGSLLLVGAVAALFWFVVFPWMDPFLEETLLPWNEGQLEGDFAPAEGPENADPDNPAVPEDGAGPVDSEEPVPEDPYDIPYETD
jgi:hypothetical protein